MRRAIMVILDGLRRDFVTEAMTPHLTGFRRQSTFFPHFRSAFPSATRVVSATFATGCHPARHTLQGNAMALPEAGALVPHDVGGVGFLQHKRAITGQSLAVPTLAEYLAPHGGAVLFNNVSPGAAFAHDPDGFGHVYHRALSLGPGRRPVDDPLRVELDAAGDRAMTERFVAEVVLGSQAPLGVLWLGEPDHIQHNVPLGSPEHLGVLREADHNARMVIEAVGRRRDAGDDILLIIGSDHGHETVSGVVDVEAELIAAGLKQGPESTDVLSLANGTSALVYLDPTCENRWEALDGFLRAQRWAGTVISAASLGDIGQAGHYGLTFAISLAADEGANAYDVPGRSLAAKPRWGKPDRLHCGQHGGLGRFEQSPVLLIDGPDFPPGTESDSHARIVDLAPTIMRHLRIPAPGMDGGPLQPA
jgi:Type I phosphodiesterase / nucleotide pyrophosphatase